MSEHETPNDPDASLTNIADAVQDIQDAVNDLEDDVSIDLFKRLDKLEGAVETVEDWADNAENDDLVAIAGAKTIIDAEQDRAELLREKAPSGRGELLRKFEALEDALEDLEDTVDSLTFDTTTYIVYVNHELAGRYTNEDVTVETLLRDAGKDEDPDELGLFPLDGFRGTRKTDQAFPADRELTLSDEHRTFFESTSDGGNIA